MGSELDTKLDILRGALGGMGRVLVAFSGGVDSSFLLRVAAEELGDAVVALTTLSPTAPDEDMSDARELAVSLGVRHLVIDHDELRIPGYAANPPNRCYLCKGGLYDICRREAQRLGIEVIADGVNADDLDDYRPGLAAAGESGIVHPLVEAGLGKAEVRALSRKLGLRSWDRPASPCLSSRFPYGTAITREGLLWVGAAERILRQRGFRACRVRYHDPIARIEVPVEDLPRLLSEELRDAVVLELKAIGFRYVTVDLQGYRSGSLNEVLKPLPASTPPSADRLES